MIESSDLTSEDLQKPWELLRRMLDTEHLPLVNASRGCGPNLITFVPRSLVLSLLKMIKVDGLRLAADKHDGGIGKNDNRTHPRASMHQDVRLPGSVPIPGYSRQAEAYGLGSMNPRLFPVVPGAISIAGMDQFTLWLVPTD